MVNAAGVVKRVGTSTVNVTLDVNAYPVVNAMLVVYITHVGTIAGGLAADAKYQVSLDGGVTRTLEADLVLTDGALSISGTGIILDFSDGALVDDTSYEYLHIKDSLALLELFDSHQADLLAHEPMVTQTFGWREPDKQLIQGARVDWVPGSPDGDAGDVIPARNVGVGHARNLADFDEAFTIYLKGHDPTQPYNERAQYELVYYLWAAWYAALYRVGHGNIRVESAEWNIEKKERRLGAQIVATCRLRSPIPDDVSVTVSPLTIRLSAILASTTQTTLEITQ